MTAARMQPLYRDPVLGIVSMPASLARALAPVSYPGQAVRRARPGEIGVFVAHQRRPIFREDGLLLGYETIWNSISHNERVDAGALYQANQVFAGGSTPTAPSATVYFNVIAIANATLTKAKGDQSLGSTSASATTNEFTTLGLSRVTATTPGGGDYTAPASLGATFAQLITKQFTASGSATGKGAGIFNSTTVSGSKLYVEDNFSSDAVLVTSDLLTVNATINN